MTHPEGRTNAAPFAPPDTNTEPDTDSDAALSARDLRRVFSTKAGETVGVDGVSLAIAPGELVALLGPNGSGKSTLMGMLATIDPPDAGVIEFASASDPPIAIDRDASHADRRAARARLGVVFQTHTLDPLLTVRENLRIAASLVGLRDAESRIDRRLADLRIADRVRDRVGTLSGGLARRADLARAILHDPAVLLLDEPTAGLDPDARAGLLETLESLKRAPAAPAVLMTTHLTEEADRADRVLILDAGRIVAEGTPGGLRSALGERLVVVEHAPADADAVRERLSSLGLAPRDAGHAGDPTRTVADLAIRRDGSGEAGGSGEANGSREPHRGVAETLRALAESDLRFRIGPPSLDDVYRAHIRRPEADRSPHRSSDRPTTREAAR